MANYRVEGERVWQRFSGEREGTLWYYRALVGAFRAAAPCPLVEELARAVADLERLAAEGR